MGIAREAGDLNMKSPQATIERTAQDTSVSAVLVALGLRFVLRTFLFAVVIAIVIGVPTDVVANPWFTRMTPVVPLDYVFLVATSAITGAVIASAAYGNWFASRGASPTGTAGGVLGWLAIGCPICNKLVVALLGVSGALRFFGPVQPLIGAASIVLGIAALAIRFRAVRGMCVPIPGVAQRCQIAGPVVE